MPRNADGTISRARYTSLKLGELSSVDRPAQGDALAVCMKRMDDPDALIAEVAKYICSEDGAHEFKEVLAENRFSSEIWPFTDALSQSIRSIVGDKSVSTEERESKINSSVAQFLAAVRTISPEIEQKIEGLISKREITMLKTVEQLEAEIATLKSDHTAEIQALTGRAEKAEGELTVAQKALADATDEVITVGGVELRKSEVGAANFSVSKALRDERDMAVFEKRAEAEFSHITGTTAEKAALLKAIDAMPEEARKSATAVLESAEKMAAAGFAMIGVNGGLTETAKAAGDTFTAKVQEIKKRDGSTEAEAMSTARREFPKEFAAYNN